MLAAVVTDQPWCYLLGTGYACSLLQGVGHEICAERANLPELAKRSGVERAADEIAHVLYFPILLFHSAHQAIVEYRAQPCMPVCPLPQPGLNAVNFS